MAGLYTSIMTYAERSNHIDPEHVWPLGVGLSVAVISILDIGVLERILISFDSFANLRLLLIMGLKGVAAGMVAHYAYSTTEFSFQSRDSTQTKENSLFILVIVGVIGGLLVDVAIPRLVEPFRYVVLQSAGLLLVLGMWYLHLLIENWKLKNEWPHLLSGALIAFGPYLPLVL